MTFMINKYHKEIDPWTASAKKKCKQINDSAEIEG